MREFFQSCTTLAFSLSLLTLELVDDLTYMDSHEFRGAATKTVDAVSNAALQQLGPRLRFAFDSLNDVQRGAVGMMFDFSLAIARRTVNRLADGTPPNAYTGSDYTSDGNNHGRARHARTYGGFNTRPGVRNEGLSADRTTLDPENLVPVAYLPGDPERRRFRA